MHVVVVGCGRVGSSLARRLTSESHTVSIIDKRAQAFDRFLSDWPGTKIVGYGFDRDRLAEAGIEKADALAAVTSGDNSNIIVARIAKETYQVANVMARIYDPRRATVYERLGIATVATVEWTADQAMRRIAPDVTRAEWVHRTAGVAVVERRLPVARVGRPLGAIEQEGRWRLVGLTRLGKASVPSPGTIGQEDDVLLLAVGGDQLDELDTFLASTTEGGH
ncbi:MAG: TrkA family potassium uptake protein [Acidimicrobiia bacterium]